MRMKKIYECPRDIPCVCYDKSLVCDRVVMTYNNEEEFSASVNNGEYTARCSFTDLLNDLCTADSKNSLPRKVAFLDKEGHEVPDNNIRKSVVGRKVVYSAKAIEELGGRFG